MQPKEKDSLTIFTEVSEKLEKYRSKPTPGNSKLVFKSVLELVNKEASIESAYESCEKVAMNMECSSSMLLSGCSRSLLCCWKD